MAPGLRLVAPAGAAFVLQTPASGAAAAFATPPPAAFGTAPIGRFGRASAPSSSSGPLRSTAAAPSSASASSTSTDVDVAVAVDRVIVCTGELCRCQGDDVPGADDILADLTSRDVPYPVEESICLGACGMGAVVSVEYEDGTEALTFGLEDALAELGLEAAAAAAAAVATTTVEAVEEAEVELRGGAPAAAAAAAAVAVGTVPAAAEAVPPQAIAEAEAEAEAETSSSSAAAVAVAEEPPRKTEVPSSPSAAAAAATATATATTTTAETPVREEERHGARDRMREAAARSGPAPTNPWADAAAYLARKAGEKLFG